MGGARALEWIVGGPVANWVPGTRTPKSDRSAPRQPGVGDQGRPGLAVRRLLRHRTGTVGGIEIARRFAHLTTAARPN